MDCAMYDRYRRALLFEASAMLEPADEQSLGS
jgi:hypothetical protein